jgi:hypothetical protein
MTKKLRSKDLFWHFILNNRNQQGDAFFKGYSFPKDKYTEIEAKDAVTKIIETEYATMTLEIRFQSLSYDALNRCRMCGFGWLTTNHRDCMKCGVSDNKVFCLQDKVEGRVVSRSPSWCKTVRISYHPMITMKYLKGYPPGQTLIICHKCALIVLEKGMMGEVDWRPTEAIPEDLYGL